MARALLRLARWRDMLEVDDREGAERVLQAVARLAELAELFRCRDHRDRRLFRYAHRRRRSPKDHDDQEREEGAQQEQEEGARKHRGREIAAGDDEGGAHQFPHSPGSSSSIARAAASPAIATNASCRPGRSIASVSMPALPSISALSSGSGPVSGSSKIHSPPSLRAVSGSARRQAPSLSRVRRRTMGRSRSRASSTRPLKATLPPAMIAMLSQRR